MTDIDMETIYNLTSIIRSNTEGNNKVYKKEIINYGYASIIDDAYGRPININETLDEFEVIMEKLLEPSDA